jgi:hypothetical protein
MELIMINVQNCVKNELHSKYSFAGLDKTICSIEKYSSCNHTNYLSYIVYRICQLFCAIFGRSDWQLAKKALIHVFQSDTLFKSKEVKEHLNAKNIADKSDAFLKLIVDYYQIANKNSKNLKGEFQKADKKFTSSQVLLEGIPNAGRTCYANASAMALYPIKHILLHARDVTVCDAILKVYEEPVKQAPAMVNAFNDCMLKNLGRACNDSWMCLNSTFNEIVKKHPELKSDLTNSAFADNKEHNFNSICCSGGQTILSKTISENLSNLTDVKLSKYLIIEVRDMHGMVIDGEEFRWNNYKLKLLSASTGGTGHATTYIKLDNVWTHFNDDYVHADSPIGKGKFAVLILETEKVN